MEQMFTLWRCKDTSPSSTTTSLASSVKQIL
jgi:hypothetical protein